MMANRCLYAICFLLSYVSQAQTDTISISSSSIESEIRVREAALARPLNEEEIHQMVKNLVIDEILLNEAIKLELHLTDREVRHRLISIMDYNFQPRVPKPLDSELADYFDDHRGDFYEPTLFSFDHLFFTGQPNIKIDELNRSSDWESMGDPYWVNKKIESKPSAEISVFLGAEIAVSIESDSIGKWLGPFRSASGYHFIRVTGRIQGSARDYHEVKDLVLDAWTRDRRNKLFEEKIKLLRSDYKLILPPEYTDQVK